MEIRAPPTSLRLAPPPASASFRRTALKSSFINGSVSLRVVQIRRSNVSRFKCNANLFDRLSRVVKDNASSLKAQLDQQRGVVDNLISNTKLLESKIAEAKQKKGYPKSPCSISQDGNTKMMFHEKLFEFLVRKIIAHLVLSVMAMESQAEALGQLATDDLEGKVNLVVTNLSSLTLL
ncbi:hypothetical protein HU200_067159 [Digitaria exilis]|uniref:Uncharacterized protein n=1 Tax=Digitaria exilis TaxID=1010633 RepID=A0A835DWL2_9POAL|nr:hypothetical protein HU200_067159 [Digitaria exilis]